MNERDSGERARTGGPGTGPMCKIGGEKLMGLFRALITIATLGALAPNDWNGIDGYDGGCDE